MPRVGLTRDSVVETAAIMADEVGLNSLTLAALAERLGVKQPSLYKHLDSLAGLHRSVSLLAKRELGEAISRAAVGRSGADAIFAMSHAYRNWAIQHPGRYVVSQTPPAPGDAEDEITTMSAIRVITDVLTAYNLEGDDSVDAIRAFRSLLHGFVSLETTGGFALKVDIERSFERLIHGFTVALDHWKEPVEIAEAWADRSANSASTR
ncbi:transcriptional regulator, TetR family [Agreia bicolorata]|uniref:Transcriptional regulator, TetR family n=1 Tax=Agreia bicolorata TaxID=110935 RepID=A0A1T4Y3S7_9MICO|nr:TetR-like C-terminal domain-containing protein [Agreia bicolorata]SKA96148.1 transcriptional regulator, TetR family [Agreia bicolorata]